MSTTTPLIQFGQQPAFRSTDPPVSTTPPVPSPEGADASGSPESSDKSSGHPAFHPAFPISEEITELKEDYKRVCQTVAEMHAAAVGEVTGPRRGVVEDVQDMYSELLNLRERLIYLSLELEAAQMAESNWRILAQARHKLPTPNPEALNEFLEQERRRFLHSQSFVL